jgi:hypothetical protein
MSEELRPCPFCGSADIRTEPGINLNYCDKCSAEANIEHWNTRPIEDALNKRIAELEAEIERLTSHSNIERQDDKWIPVSERLPEDLQSIIVFTKDRKTYIIRFLELYGREGFGSLSDIVTHWMPLPVLPESPNDTQSSTIVYGKEGEE